MKIKWCGHASFLITSNTGLKILTDPYEPGGFGGSIRYAPIEETIDIVTVSHDHADHNYVKNLKGNPVIFNKEGEAILKGITFKAILSYHDHSQGKERGKNLIISFIVDEINICHLGDLGHIPDENIIRKLGKVDILLIPVGGTYTIDSTEASKIVKTLNPSIAIPMHYKTSKCDFPITGVEEFIKDKTNVKREGKTEIEVNKEDLPSCTEIIVLNPAL